MSPAFTAAFNYKPAVCQWFLPRCTIGVEAREINQVLYGALKKLCKQEAQYGWHLTDEAKAELEAFDQK